MQKIIDSILVIAMMFTCVASFGQTSILALSSDNLFKAYDNYQKGIYAKAFEIFKSLSDNGDMHATYGLGVCYYNGRGTTKNLAEAFKCFDKSYSRGNKSAAFILGKCYFYGHGTGKDFDKAEKYLTEAANQGNQEAKTLVSKINAEREKERQKLLAGVVVVDLGLPSGTLWADRNVGAALPEDYGDYFAWGETTTKSNFTWSTLKYCEDNNVHKFSKYNTQSKYGSVDNKTTLERADDAATANWGSGWRMPTQQQFQELNDNCTWTWTTRNGKNGYEVKGKNGNSIFLPAAGFRSGTGRYDAGSFGHYWSSSLNTDDPYRGRGLHFCSSYVSPDYGYDRWYGRSVRAVRCR